VEASYHEGAEHSPVTHSKKRANALFGYHRILVRLIRKFYFTIVEIKPLHVSMLIKERDHVPSPAREATSPVISLLPLSFAHYFLYACEQCARGREIPQLRDLGQRLVDSRIATTMEPCGNQDRRPTFARQAMHQQIPSPDSDRHREHYVFELLRGDRARVWDWDLDVRDFRSSLKVLFPAERDNGGNPLRIGTRQLFCIFKTAEIETFPNLRHGNNCCNHAMRSECRSSL